MSEGAGDDAGVGPSRGGAVLLEGREGRRKRNAQLQPRSTRAAHLAAALLLVLTGCNATDVKERGWDIPTDPQEKAAYDYAHALKLPDSVPKPVPFDFTEARLRALWPWSPSVSEQYFEHLCKTEAGEYIFKTVENVEGVFQMRPRPDPGKLDYDRYAPEEPTGLGYSNDVDEKLFLSSVANTYVQPMMGTYSYLERPKAGDPGKIERFERGVNDDPPKGYRRGYSTGVPGKWGWGFRIPFMVVKAEDAQRHARYGYTWRGIKRERDREFSIGSGEYLIVDLDTNEVLAVKRRFKISGHDKNTPSRIWWGNARPCDGEFIKRGTLRREPVPIDIFVKHILKPVQGLNEPFIPEQYQRMLKGEAK